MVMVAKTGHHISNYFLVMFEVGEIAGMELHIKILISLLLMVVNY